MTEEWSDLSASELLLASASPFDLACIKVLAMEKRITELEKELKQHKAITEAAKFLVKVKRHKETRTAWYLASWPIALRKIEEALAQLPEEGE